MAALTDVATHLTLVGPILLVLGLVHVALPRVLAWQHELSGASLLNRQVSYVHCYFIGLVCVLWGLLPLVAGPDLLRPHPVTRLVLVGAVGFWGSRLVIQLGVFNRHARRSRAWCAVSLAGTALWAYLTAVWSCALATQL
jgi:hypothetical protein